MKCSEGISTCGEENGRWDGYVSHLGVFIIQSEV